MAGSHLSAIAQAYDRLAPEYDKLYHDAISEAENDVVRELLPRGDAIIDLGCGTGLGLELALQNRNGAVPGQEEIVPLRYLGLDISREMIARARARHPKQWWYRGDMLLVADLSVRQHLVADVVLSLFGSPNYAPFENVCAAAFRALRPGGTAFLMPFTLARYGRGIGIAARNETVAVSVREAQRSMYGAGFKVVKVRTLGDTCTDRMANDLSPETLRQVLRERLRATPNPFYLIVTGRKP